MLLRNKLDVPEEWRYDSSYIIEHSYCIDDYSTGFSTTTTAMKLACNKIIPPKEWYHNPNIKVNNVTVCYYL